MMVWIKKIVANDPFLFEENILSDYRQEVAPSPTSPVCRGGEEPVLVGQEIRGASGQGAEGEGED